MLDIALKERLNLLLRYIADELDISETHHKLAEQHYQAVGNWLGADGSLLAPFNPDIYPQGSFRLGTVVKPISGEDRYDIDLVCQLELPRQQVTQRRLKQMVGDRLKENKTYAEMLEPEGRRCWTLQYADSARFHLDILPAIPDNYGWLLSMGVSPELAKTAICLTDKNRWDLDPDWPKSNPRGYAEWFKQRMIVIYEARRAVLAKSLNVNIEEVPVFKVKTPLQRAVQILKRHRDIMFADDPDDKPISIIITTLAARAYNNEPDLFDALQSILQGMPQHIRSEAGKPLVANPVNPAENFADKWAEYPLLEWKFRQWLAKARADLDAALAERDTGVLRDRLEAFFGERVVSIALDRAGLNTSDTRPPGIFSSAILAVKTIFNVAYRQSPNWPMALHGTVRIGCRYVRNGYRPETLPADGPGLPKGCKLLFDAKTDISRPFKVYWQVVNTGTEAARANDLRGDFFESWISRGGLSHEERTSYFGKHCISCFIVKDGRCVARSDDFIINIQ